MTNFEMNRYDVEAIAKSALPVGGAAKRLKLSLDSEEKPSLNHDQQAQCSSGSSNINFAAVQPISTIPCGIPFDVAATAPYHHSLFHHLQPNYIACSDSGNQTPSIATPVAMLQQPAEFFIWPHQSY